MTTISVKTRANIYLQFSQLEQAGFSALQACDLLEKTTSKTAKNIQQMQRYLNQGNSIAESGFKAGVFSLFDKELLLAGEASGNLGSIYQKLADYYAIKNNRYKSIKSKLHLPLTVLTIALFIQPLPLLISNEITNIDYLLATAGLLLTLMLATYLIFKLSTWLTESRSQFGGMGNLFHYFQLKLPVISSWVITRQLNDFMYSLGLMLSAGLPMLEALPKAVDTIKNSVLKTQFQPTISSTQNGNSLAQSLSPISQVDDHIIQQLSIGENSGRLAETLLHFTSMQAEKIKLQEDLLTEWIPRIIYLIVATSLARSIISSNPFSPIAL